MICSLCSCHKIIFHCHPFAISTALCHGIKAVNLLLQPLMVPFWPEQTSFRNMTRNSHFEQANWRQPNNWPGQLELTENRPRLRRLQWCLATACYGIGLRPGRPGSEPGSGVAWRSRWPRSVPAAMLRMKKKKLKFWWFVTFGLSSDFLRTLRVILRVVRPWQAMPKCDKQLGEPWRCSSSTSSGFNWKDWHVPCNMIPVLRGWRRRKSRPRLRCAMI